MKGELEQLEDKWQQNLIQSTLLQDKEKEFKYVTNQLKKSKSNAVAIAQSVVLSALDLYQIERQKCSLELLAGNPHPNSRETLRKPLSPLRALRETASLMPTGLSPILTPQIDDEYYAKIWNSSYSNSNSKSKNKRPKT